MKTFIEWMNTVGTEFVDDRQIDALYNKAKFSVKLVQLYSKMTSQKILHNISTIAPLNQGVYGLYNSSENKKLIGPSIANKIKFKFDQGLLDQNNLNKLPNSVIKKYIPDIDINQIKPSNVIHVNVQKIVRELGDTKEAVIEIASTIIHEATHDLEYQSTGNTNESGPKNAESKFKYWVSKNWNFILTRIPQLANL